MSRRWQRAALLGACVVVGIASGIGLDVGLGRKAPSAVPLAAAEKRAASLLSCYAYQLAQFSDVATEFSQALFQDASELRKHAAPLKDVILATNASYSAIEQASLGLMLDLHGSVQAPLLACKLQRAEAFQWRRYRPALNALLVNVIIAWQHDATEMELDRIHVQQKDEWPAFARSMRDGVMEFQPDTAKAKCD
jgi:hypothetical protein